MIAIKLDTHKKYMDYCFKGALVDLFGIYYAGFEGQIVADYITHGYKGGIVYLN